MGWKWKCGEALPVFSAVCYLSSPLWPNLKSWLLFCLAVYLCSRDGPIYLECIHCFLASSQWLGLMHRSSRMCSKDRLFSNSNTGLSCMFARLPVPTLFSPSSLTGSRSHKLRAQSWYGCVFLWSEEAPTFSEPLPSLLLSFLHSSRVELPLQALGFYYTIALPFSSLAVGWASKGDAYSLCPHLSLCLSLSLHLWLSVLITQIPFVWHRC